MPDGNKGGPSLSTPNDFQAADWTPPIVHFYGVYGPPSYNPYDQTLAYMPASDYGIETMDYDLSNVPQPRSLHLTIHGTSDTNSSTIKYQWTPPNNPATGQPDAVNFPAPPLFVLERVEGFTRTTQWGPSGGVTASGTFTDGVGGSPLPLSGVPAITSPQTNWGILHPVGSPAVMSPAPQVSLDLSSTGAGGAQGGGVIKQYAFPITLSAPNPLTNPLLGDGTNQYVYDAEQPDGYLAVPAFANAVGASTADTTWLLSHVALYVSPAMQTGAQPFQWENYGSQMYVYTPGTYPDNQTNYPSAAFIYKGLPPDNSYFGNHLMTMQVDGTASQTANYQLFFGATANNYPGSSEYNEYGVLGYTGIPNWYFYYNQLYTATENYYDTSSSYYNWLTGIYIGNEAHGSSEIRVFDLQTDVTGKKWVHLAGNLSIKGIHSFIYSCEHEQGHAYTTQNNILTLSGSGTADGDGIDDTWEARNNFKNNDYDTACAYLDLDPNSADYQKGDRECLADIQALGKLLPKKGLWQQDWANDGIQWGKWAPYGEFETPSASVSLPYFPWNYVPNEGGNYPDPPGSVLVSLSQLDGGGN